MNERIRELKNKTLDKHFSYTWTAMNYGDVNRFAEKFAELIVQECVGIADHSNVTGKSIIGERIKEHFGVEE